MIKLKTGDRIAYNKSFIRTFMMDYDASTARGEIVGFEFGTVARIQWEVDLGFPDLVNTFNLVRAKKGRPVQDID